MEKLKLIIIKINKTNFAINENKKNYQSIMQQFSLIQQQNSSMQQQLSQINQNIKNININTINNQELKFPDGKYMGQVVNGMA